MWRLGSRMLPLIPNRAHIVQGGHTMLYPNRRDVLITLGALAAGAAIGAGSIFAWDDGFDNFTTKHRREWYANDYNQRRYTDFLQGLGPEGHTAHHVPPRLASFVGRLGRADAVLPCQRLSRRRA